MTCNDSGRNNSFCLCWTINSTSKHIPFQNQSKNKLINGLQLEQTKINSCQNQTESLTNEIHELQKTLNEFKNEKNESIQNKMDGGENDERQNLVRHITEEKIKYFFSYSKFNSFLIVKDQYDQQNKRNR
ncbi:unnamed protein product [Rotaria socialis]|uniref:Uncharacterized protein n=1 Tax=Rotaria socialis TaxID=392032 RepID=A0A818XMX2_9BILA|nr:unnamed protein product [Rotaria socialis]